MAILSIDVRRRLVQAYNAGKSGTYEQTADLFAVGRATVSRLLRRKRETGDVKYKPRGGNNPRRVDLEWLRRHATAHPDARLQDRVEAWEAESSVRVSRWAMCLALRAIGWSYKKNSSGPRTRSVKRSSPTTSLRR